MIIGDRVKRLMEMNDKFSYGLEWTQEMYCEDDMTNEFINCLYEQIENALSYSRCLTSRFMEMHSKTEDDEDGKN